MQIERLTVRLANEKPVRGAAEDPCEPLPMCPEWTPESMARREGLLQATKFSKLRPETDPRGADRDGRLCNAATQRVEPLYFKCRSRKSLILANIRSSEKALIVVWPARSSTISSDSLPLAFSAS